MIQGFFRKAAMRRLVFTLILVALLSIILYLARQPLSTAIPVWRPYWNKLTPDGKAQAESQLRLSVVQAVGVAGAGFALLFTARTYRLSRRVQVTDRLNRALERLGSEQMYIRLGGILALEQIVQESPQQAGQASGVLSAFLRDRTPRDQPADTARFPDRPNADVAAALAALSSPIAMEVSTLLPGADLEELSLVGANLKSANLERAQLGRADLRHARFLRGNLRSASLTRADLRHASLTGADLRDSWLNDADLRSAFLVGANLRGADLSGADFSDATLDLADLRNVEGLTNEQLNAVRSMRDVRLGDTKWNAIAKLYRVALHWVRNNLL